MSARLLIVDDEIEIREMLSRHFRLLGYEAHLAGDGQEAIDVLNNKRIDIIVSDIMMPVMDGVALLRAVRRQFPMTKVIMITGYITLENALACMRNGAETCVFKPLSDLKELDDAVNAAIVSLKRWQDKLLTLRGMKTMEGQPTA